MSIDVAAVDGALYKAKDFDCIGKQLQSTGWCTFFRGWAHIRGTVIYSEPCDTMTKALERAQQLYDHHARATGAEPH